MDVTVSVQGLQGLEDALSNLGPKLAKKIVRQGLTAAGQVMLDAVKELTPVAKEGTPQREAGELRDAMKMKVKLSAKEESGTVVIGAEYKKEDGAQSPGVYNSFVEFGSIHGAAQPHMRPAFDRAKERALDEFVKVTREGVNSLKP